MGLPDLIEIVPPAGPVQAAVTVPGSKSITNRALVLAALSGGTTTLCGALWSEDTQAMVNALRVLGFAVEVRDDARERCNRVITVRGCGGAVPGGGTCDRPLELEVGNAGTAARFLTALVCLGHGVCRLRGTARMHERPQAGLFKALRALGYRIDSPNDRLPALVHGAGARPGRCEVAVAESSQFASALLLGAGVGGWEVEVTGADAEEASYVGMTRRLIAAFPRGGGEFAVEADASSGSYFLAAGWLLACADAGRGAANSGLPADGTGARMNTPRVTVANWPATDWQVDARFPAFLPLPRLVSREHGLGDSIMTAVVVAADREGGWMWLPGPAGPGGLVPAAAGGVPVLFTELGRLRVQECERVAALRQELAKCGADVVECGDTLRVTPAVLRGALIESHGDHRMAMSFAILGLKVPGMKIKNPACARKTFPDFFRKLAEPPPAGLGVAILEAHTRRALACEELAAT